MEQLSDQTKFRLHEINAVKNYFNSEIQETKIMNKKLSKYIAAFDYIDKTLIVLSVTSGGKSIISLARVIGVPAEIASACFTLVYSLTTEIIKKILQITRSINKKYNNILVLPKSTFNSIEALISQALIDLEINHEEFKLIVKEKEKCERMKENTMKSNDELGENNKSSRENRRNA